MSHISAGLAATLERTGAMHASAQPSSVHREKAVEHIFLAELKALRHDVDSSLLMVQNHARRGRFLCFRTEAAGKITRMLAEQSIVADHRADRLRIGFGIYHYESHAQKLARALRR